MKGHSIATLLFIVILGIGAFLEYSLYSMNSEGLWILPVTFVIAWFIASAVKVADQWDRAVIYAWVDFSH